MVRVHEVSSSGLPCNGINCFVHLVPYYLWHLPPCATILMVPPRAPAASCMALSPSATSLATSTIATLRMTSSTIVTCRYAQLPRHRYKGLPPYYLSNLQPQHLQKIGYCDCGEMSAHWLSIFSFFSFSCLTICAAPTVHMGWRRGALQYIWISLDMVD